MTGPEPLAFVGANSVRFRGRTLLYFSGCDYFRLARDARLADAAKKTLASAGLNVAASRVTTGNHEIYPTLEAELARFFDAESAVLFPDGYFGPLAVASAFSGEFSHALIDELAHGALVDTAKFLACPIKSFSHRDPADLKKIISGLGRTARPIVLTDGMFSHDGSVAPLGAYLKILPRNGFMLVDDAHGAGVLGSSGKGALELEGISRQCVIQCITLSKAFGAYGGAVLAAPAIRETILSRSRVFAGTTPLPPPLAGAALAALKILRHEPQRRKYLFRNVRFVRERLGKAGWNIPETPGPIVRLPALPEKAERRLQRMLLKSGIYPPYLRYGNASHGAFRFVISSEHSISQLEKMCSVLAQFQLDFSES